MTDDIVTRLRKVAPIAKLADPFSSDPFLWSLAGLLDGAADEIERLREEKQHLETLIHDLIDQLPPQPNYLAEAQQAIRKAARQ